MKVELIKDLIATYGKHHQCDVAIEECSELIKEVCKMMRGRGDIDNLAEEMADVLNCIDQLQIMFGITDEILYAWKQRKEKRTEDELNDFKKNADEFVNGRPWVD